MTQQEYLKKLKRALYFRYTNNDIDEIIAEYRSFFETGLSEGRREQEICESFGAPHKVALTIIGDDAKHPKILSILFKRLIVCGFLIWLYIWRYDLQLFNRASLIIIGLSMSILWFFLGGNLRSSAQYPYNDKARWRMYLPHILVFAGTLGALLDPYYIFNHIPETTEELISHINNVIAIDALLMFGIILWGVYGFLRKCPEYYSLICHAGGALLTLMYLNITYGNLCDYESYFHNFFFSFIPYLIGVVFAFIFFIFVKILRKRGKC